VSSESDVDLVKHVVVEVVFVRADAGFLMRINAQGDGEVFLSVVLVHERVNVGGVGSRITNDERRVHVTGGKSRRPDESRAGHHACQQQGKAAIPSVDFLVHVFWFFLCWFCCWFVCFSFPFLWKCWPQEESFPGEA